MYIRSDIISQVESFYDTSHIKVLVGPRGAGKSTILEQLIARLKESKAADNQHIIFINFDYIENEKYRDITYLEQYIREKVVDKDMYYVFFDEIWNAPHFERMLNSLWSDLVNIRLFATCSNTRIFPLNVNPIILHRYVLFYVTPATYSESCHYLKQSIKDKRLFMNYLTYGGFFERFRYKKASEVKNLLYQKLYAIYTNDIVIRLGVNELEDITHIAKCMLTFNEELFSYIRLAEIAEKNNYSITENNMYDSVDCLSMTMLFRECRGYNVQTDTLLAGIYHYYFADFGFASILGYDIKNHMDGALKNLIWIELTKRGYTLYTGSNRGKIIDFVAKKKCFDSETKDKWFNVLYIQVRDTIEDGKTLDDLIQVLEDIPRHPNFVEDNGTTPLEALLNGTLTREGYAYFEKILEDPEIDFPWKVKKYILSLDNEDLSRKSVIHKNILDFLADESI